MNHVIFVTSLKIKYSRELVTLFIQRKSQSAACVTYFSVDEQFITQYKKCTHKTEMLKRIYLFLK